MEAKSVGFSAVSQEISERNGAKYGGVVGLQWRNARDCVPILYCLPSCRDLVCFSS